jgi:tetratricopeptide (TPR) repeat protein
LLSTNPDEAIVSGVDVEQVVATAREVFGDDHATVAATLSSHALQLQSAGELEAAEQLYRESLAIWRERYGRDNISVANTLRLLGLLNLTKGDDRAAERAFRESIRITRALPGEETLTLSETLALLGGALRDRGQYGEAEAALRDSIRIRRAIAPAQHLQIAVTISALTNVLVLAGKEDATAEIMPEVLATWRAALPEKSLLLARTLTEIGIYYLDHEEIETAEALLREALDIFRAAPEPLMAYYRYALRGLSRILDRRQDLSGLVPLAIEAVDVAHRLEEDLWLAETQKDLANLCWDIAKDPERSRAEYEAALQGVEAYRTQRPDVPSVINTHGVVLYRLGRYEEALEILAESDAHYSKERAGGFPHDVAFIAMAHHQLGHEAEARAALERLRQIMQQPEFADDDDAQAFRAEAELVIRGAQALPRAGE